MASQLKDIQFSSPVLNGTTANNKTTWTYGANDVVVFGCGSDGCDYSERHYGYEFHDGAVTFGDCSYEHHNGYESHNGNVTFDDCSYESHNGKEYHYGCEYHCGYEEHSGCEYHNGAVTFGGCSYEYHNGYEFHDGNVTFGDCSYEFHNGTESHNGTEEHYGCETHCGDEEHNGWVQFSGSCSCESHGFTGTNIRVSGIAVVDPTDPSNKVLLTYSELKTHGF